MEVTDLGLTISFGIQKGGVGKTTTTAITSHLLSREAKVLAVDFDSQGNLTQFLTQKNIYDFDGQTVLEALQEKNASPYIYKVSDQLHVLPAQDLLATFSRYLYEKYRGNRSALLRDTLAPVKDDYDYILIDLPPNLGDQTINALTASDYAVVMLQSEPFCYDALDRYLETLSHIKNQTNPDLVLAGILTTMLDARTTIDAAILDRARVDYQDVVFNSVIRRRSRIKEYSLSGMLDESKQGKADIEALSPYIAFIEELKERVQARRH